MRRYTLSLEFPDQDRALRQAGHLDSPMDEAIGQAICARAGERKNASIQELVCKPGPRNGGGGPQTISFVEGVRKERVV